MIIPNFIVDNKEIGKYRMSSYIFLRYCISDFGEVIFPLNKYYEYINVSNDRKNGKNYKSSTYSLNQLIDIFNDNNSSFLTSIDTDKKNSSISFHASNRYLLKEAKNYFILKIDSLRTIRQYCIENKDISFNTLLSIYLYIQRRMYHKRKTDDDGQPVYSGMIVHFYSYDKNIIEDLDISFNTLHKSVKQLQRLKLIYIYKPIDETYKVKNKMVFNKTPKFYFNYKDNISPHDEDVISAVKMYYKYKN